jgi:F0F1-type ATP synthase delta subunit
MCEQEVFTSYIQEFQDVAEKIRNFTFQKNDFIFSSDPLKQFLILLLKKKRLKFFPVIVDAFISLKNERAGLQNGIITYAEDFEQENKMHLMHYLNHLFQKQLQITWIKDPSLEKGFLVEVAYARLDVTLQALKTLKIKKIVSSLRDKIYHIQNQGLSL